MKKFKDALPMLILFIIILLDGIISNWITATILGVYCLINIIILIILIERGVNKKW